MKSKPPATEVPKYWSPGATAEALILCGGETQDVGEKHRISGREGVSFQFYSVNRLVHSRDTEALERKSKVLPGEMAFEQRLEGGWGLTKRVRRVGGGETARGQCSGKGETRHQEA